MVPTFFFEKFFSSPIYRAHHLRFGAYKSLLISWTSTSIAAIRSRMTVAISS